MGSTGAQVAATAILFIGIILSTASIRKYIIFHKNKMNLSMNMKVLIYLSTGCISRLAHLN